MNSNPYSPPQTASRQIRKPSKPGCRKVSKQHEIFMSIVGLILGGGPPMAATLYYDWTGFFPEWAINYIKYPLVFFALAFLFGGFWVADKLYRQLFLLSSDAENH